jgi:hypothetical protein
MSHLATAQMGTQLCDGCQGCMHYCMLHKAMPIRVATTWFICACQGLPQKNSTAQNMPVSAGTFHTQQQ